jgi:condensation enzyme
VAYIFDEAPEVLRDSMEQGTAVSAFQVFHNPVETTGQPMGPQLRYSQMRSRLLSQPVSSSIPNGTLWTLDIEPGTGMFGSAKYRGDEFEEATIAAMARQFCDVLRTLVTDPDARLQQL